MHTGKYEKLRFRNICRVCEAAGWAAECPGPRSSPTTAEWRVMRILYPSVSRHSPSSPPTFFILSSHHTNSYGHKLEREGVRVVKWKRERYTGHLWLLLSAHHQWLTIMVLFYCPSHPQPTSTPPPPPTWTTTHAFPILWPSASTLLTKTYWVNLLVLPGQTIHHIWGGDGEAGNNVISSAEVLS